MTDLKVSSNRLFVNVDGGAKIATEFKTHVKKGDNEVSIPTLGGDTSPGSLDVIETGKTPFGTLELRRAQVFKLPNDPATAATTDRRGARLLVHANKAGDVSFTVPADISAGVGINHRLVVTDDGKAELSSRALITNHSETAIKDANLSITVGDTQNKGFGRGVYAARAMALESSDTSVAAVSSSVYRFDHPDKLSLEPKESLAVNLFNKDFTIKNVGKELNFEGQGNFWYNEPKSQQAGPVNSTYRVANSEGNGLGVVLPRGNVEIMKADGTLLSSTAITNTPQGRELVLDGGQAFDFETKRSQTGFKSVVSGTGSAKKETYDVGQELALKNCGKNNEKVNVKETIPASRPGDQTVVSKVAINGTPLDASAWKYDEKEGALIVPGIEVKGNTDVKLTYEVRFTQEKY